MREAGAGEPLVLLHGLASSSRYWLNMQPLAQRYRVLAPDLLGFGRSPKPPRSEYMPADHLAALRPALTRRSGGPFHLLGHSLGSLLALHYAAAYPEDVQTLTLASLPVLGSCAWGHGASGAMNRWHRITVHTASGHRFFNAGMRAVAPFWMAMGPRLRRDLPAVAARAALDCTWSSYWRSLEAVVYGTDVPGLLDRVHAPVLVIHGPGDTVAPIEPVRALAAARADVRLVEIAGAGHNPYHSDHGAFVAALESALARGYSERSQPVTIPE